MEESKMSRLPIHRFSMGATSAIVTSMGLVAGLTHGDTAKTSIIAGLLVIAIADNISDTLGIHIYKESEGADSREIKASTLGNFFIRLLLSLTFVLIVLLLPPSAAFLVCSAWGLVLLTILSYLIAKAKGAEPIREILYHLGIALIVIIGSKLLGSFITAQFEV